MLSAAYCNQISLTFVTCNLLFIICSVLYFQLEGWQVHETLVDVVAQEPGLDDRQCRIRKFGTGPTSTLQTSGHRKITRGTLKTRPSITELQHRNSKKINFVEPSSMKLNSQKNEKMNSQKNEKMNSQKLF
jgi:hypothetical protein